jgi:cell division protein FtsI/penicillin-binding protein 2
MVAIRHIALILSVVALSLSASSRPPGPAVAEDPNSERDGSSSLFAQSAAEALARDFPNRDISFLLLDAHTGRVLASRWDHPEVPIPMGSLLKPFTALAYGEQHNYQYPGHTCRGTSTGCWLPRGHGDVDLTAAIAHSCNSYFRTLTENLTAADISPTADRFELDRPGPKAIGPELAGLGTGWRTSPLRLARAYLGLARQRQQPGVSQILEGLALSARHGTGVQVHRAFPVPDVLVKTGTAMCTHSRHAPGDGFTVVLTPAENPQIVLIVRVHGVPGAQAARAAGEMLRRIEN